MFIKLFLIAIILYIIINQTIDCNDQNDNTISDDNTISNDNTISALEIKQKPVMQMNQSTRIEPEIVQQIQPNKPVQIEKMSNYKVQEFDSPNPWTKVIYNNEDEFPYYFHFKAVIPSLNDFEQWTQIIPNINFNPTSRELIIPSKDEASALAVANLICINFSGQMSMQNILDKDLIRISITKAKSHEVVKNKLRDQIMEVLYGKSINTPKTNFEKDSASNKISSNKNSTPTNNDYTKPMSLKSENFTDTFEHFSDEVKPNTNELGTYDSSSYSYI
jgi:hypothetical protein